MAITCAPAPGRPGPSHHPRTPTSPPLPPHLPRNTRRAGCDCAVEPVGGAGRGGGMRLPGWGAAPQARSRSGAVEALRCGGPWPGRPASFPQPPKINFAALFAAFSDPPPSGSAVGEEPSCVRPSFLLSAGAGTRRHGRYGAGAGRRAVRPAGGAARPRRSLLRGGVLL